MFTPQLPKTRSRASKLALLLSASLPARDAIAALAGTFEDNDMYQNIAAIKHYVCPDEDVRELVRCHLAELLLSKQFSSQFWDRKALFILDSLCQGTIHHTKKDK
ncbi:MAG: hypothetical protein WA885_05225 [Phormidesmis sp.]